MRLLRLDYLFFFLPWGFRLGLARSGRADEELPGLLCDSLDSLRCWFLLKNGSNSSANVSGGLVFLSLGLSAFGALGNEGRCPGPALATAESISLTVPSGKLLISACGVYFLIKNLSIKDHVEEVIK